MQACVDRRALTIGIFRVGLRRTTRAASRDCYTVYSSGKATDIKTDARAVYRRTAILRRNQRHDAKAARICLTSRNALRYGVVKVAMVSGD